MKLRKGTSKIPTPYSLMNCEKIRSTLNWEKICFQFGKKEFYFKPIQNSPHITEFLTLRKFGFLMFYPSRQ